MNNFTFVGLRRYMSMFLRDDWGLPFRRLKHAASIQWIVFHDPTNGRATVHAAGERGSRRNAATLDGGRFSLSETRGLLFAAKNTVT